MLRSDLYELWTSHDLSYDMPIFRGLRPSDRTTYWGIMEEEYLSKYADFARIEFDYGSTGIWNIPYPGSLTTGPSRGWDFLNIDIELGAELQEWVDDIDSRMQPWNDRRPSDEAWLNIRKRGLEITFNICKVSPSNIYLEFNALRQVECVNGVSFEKPYNERIKNVLGL